MTGSARIQAVQSPIIPDVAALIKETSGTISLGQGVVHYGPPVQVFERLSTFGRTVPENQYHLATGLPQLQEALQEKLRAENDIVVTADQAIAVTAGSNMGFYHALLCIADPGDEIVMMSPYYFNHEMAVVIADCRPVLVPTDANYQPRLDAIAAALTDRTRAVVTISPNNPSGAVYTPEVLQTINQLCRQRGIYHICDEAYEYFTYDGAVHFSPGSLPDAGSYTISLYSLSKAYGMASWRVGYAVLPGHLLPAFKKVQDTILICPPASSQAAALGALQAGPAYCRQFIPGIARVRHLCLERLQELGRLCNVPRSNGAFYLLARIDSDLPPMTLVEQLIRRHKVAVIPGTAFGLEACYLRIAYGALQVETVAEGMDRLISGLLEILT